MKNKHIPISGSGFGRHCPDRHKRAIKVHGYALTLLDEPNMWEVAALWHALLPPRERVFTAVAALWSLTDDEFAAVLKFMADEPA